jgi:hypothetical protein
MSARPGPSGGYHASGIPTGIKGNGRIWRLPFIPSQAMLGSSHVLGSRNSLVLSYGVYGISVDWPRTPNFQQPLNYRSMSRSFDGIPSGHHVYTARKTAPKASFCCSFHPSIRAALAGFSSKAQPERWLMLSS